MRLACRVLNDSIRWRIFPRSLWFFSKSFCDADIGRGGILPSCPDSARKKPTEKSRLFTMSFSVTAPVNLFAPLGNRFESTVIIVEPVDIFSGGHPAIG